MTILACLGLLGLALGQTPVPAPAAGDKVDFEKDLLPLFEKRCFECHQAPKEGKKPKGGYRMDTPELMVKGGKDEGEAILKGDADKSPLYKLTLLPVDDDKAMPPEKKGERLTDAEKAKIKAWINQGADFGAWKGAPGA